MPAPACVALVVVTFALTLAALLTQAHLSSGEKKIAYLY